MDKQALMMASGFVHNAIPYPYGAERVADVALKRIDQLEQRNKELQEAISLYFSIDAEFASLTKMPNDTKTDDFPEIEELVRKSREAKDRVAALLQENAE